MRPTVRVPGSAQLLAAEQVVARHLAVTPLVELAGSDGGVLLKVETVQPTGSFKIRGALAALAATPAAVAVVTAPPATTRYISIQTLLDVLGQRAH